MGRYLKRNHGTEAPSNLIFFDTESRQEVTEGKVKTTAHKLRLWCGTRVRLENGQITRRKEESGTDEESFWRFVFNNSDSHRCTWVFAHNASFDLTLIGFWKKLDEGCLTLQPMKSKSLGTDGQSRNSWLGKLCLEQNPFWCQVRNGRKTYKFVDSLNYWQMPLKTLAKSYGMEKWELPKQDDPPEKWLAYCKNDVEILEVSICNLIAKWKAENCGVFQPTAASLAMTNFRHKCDIVTPKSHTLDIVLPGSSVMTALERESYFGGRIQAYFVGERWHRMYHLDCNSLYPKVMRDFSYPRRLVSVTEGMSIEELEAKSRVYGIVASVAINSRYQTFPVRIDGKQYHCTGKYWTALCGRELQRAIDTKSIYRIGRVQIYSIAPLFKGWVDYWYQRKVEAAKAGCRGYADLQFAKLILNSLSGKWAQHGRHWKELYGTIPLIRWGGYVGQSTGGKTYERFRGVAGNCQVLTDTEENENAFVAISSFITANAREYMREVIERCPPGSVYYSATDSLICGEDAYDCLERDGLISDTELGKFKVKGIHKYCNVFGPNDYILDATQTVSGHIGKASVGTDGVLRSEIWEKTPSIISSGPRDAVLVKEIPAFYPCHTNRGRIREDGYWEPYRLSDDIYFTDRPRKGGYFSADLPDMESVHIPPNV